MLRHHSQMLERNLGAVLGGAAAAATGASASVASAAATGVYFIACSGIAAFFIFFLSKTPFSFAPLAAVGEIALIAAVSRGALFIHFI